MKQNIVVGIIFAVLIVSVAFFLRLPDDIELKPQPEGVDMSNDTITGPPIDSHPITIRIFNLDSVGHNVSFDMREASNHSKKIYKEDFYIEPSSYRDYNYTSTDEGYFMRVVTDRDTPNQVVKSTSHNFAGMRVLEFEIARDGIDIGFVYIYD
nr:hypothetical protein [uncultured Methanomethylovorans sp.]